MLVVAALLACIVLCEASAPAAVPAAVPAHYHHAPSNNEAQVNRINAARQLVVNSIAYKLGTGAGTGFLDGVPGTSLSRAAGYNLNFRRHHLGGAAQGYGTRYGTGYGTGYAHHGHVNAYNGGYHGGYYVAAAAPAYYGGFPVPAAAYHGRAAAHIAHAPHAHAAQTNNAYRQHQVNLIALRQGAGVGTAPIYGVPGTYLGTTGTRYGAVKGHVAPPVAKH